MGRIRWQKPMGRIRWQNPLAESTGRIHWQNPLAESTGRIHGQNPLVESMGRIHGQNPLAEIHGQNPLAESTGGIHWQNSLAEPTGRIHWQNPWAESAGRTKHPCVLQQKHSALTRSAADETKCNLRACPAYQKEAWYASHRRGSQYESSDSVGLQVGATNCINSDDFRHSLQLRQIARVVCAGLVRCGTHWPPATSHAVSNGRKDDHVRSTPGINASDAVGQLTRWIPLRKPRLPEWDPRTCK